MNGSAPIFRRDFLQAGTLGATGLSLSGFAPMARAAGVPDEPLEIGHEPQFVFDLHVVDTTWGLTVQGRAGEARAPSAEEAPGQSADHGRRPEPSLGAARGGRAVSHVVSVQREEPGCRRQERGSTSHGGLRGIQGRRPLGESPRSIFSPKTEKLTSRATRSSTRWTDAAVRASGAQRSKCRRRTGGAYRYLMLYPMRTAPLNGIRLIGSHDGIHWDSESDMRIARALQRHAQHRPLRRGARRIRDVLPLEAHLPRARPGRRK